ncbi:MAG: hypothetical protein F6J86_11910 [Symploca sp. SIO1B1]|nr:hypothetical protein [Symploca sp. SIO1C2]NER49448.1 hypothetical protein [Symploca sp. SIO1A3]NER94526.1 hypothetical protein [Symploca sp. SIO1B1]
MLPSPNHSQQASHNFPVLFVPLTDAQILAIKGRYQDSLPIKITVPASLSLSSQTLV